ncbi:MAG TPA: PaaI family thioesterase [Phenylobacterium sp.]|nr:PaaI family thioesterase [Phenylobacterium sp.]
MNDLRETLSDRVHQAPLAAALGFEAVSAEKGRAAMRVPWRADAVGEAGSDIIAGGVVTSLIDHVAGMAVATARGEPGAIATIDMRIDYLRPAGPRLGVTASAHCYRLTRHIAFVRAEAHDGEGETPVATAQLAFMINSPGPPMGSAT